MKIPCISCKSLFRLDSSLVKATGSLVRCSKCGNIFRVHPPADDNEPIIKHTVMDQSILDDLFEVEQSTVAKGIPGQSSEEISSHGIDEIASIGAFDQEEDTDPEIEDTDPAELFELPEYDEMIDLDESPDS
jgi:predicted Zn finger-like uncharacterized protein